ncbi:MAG: hypothetical protein PHS49_06075, partial [Candidatus Gracilibacteria bacterium]|nr:hypothetical protein [Candidatus Gracilibacteria bacterium]
MTELSNGTTNPNDLNTENPVNKKPETNDVETIQNIENTEINPTNNDILDSINLGEQNETIDINDIMDVLGVPGENSQTDNQKTENIQIGRTEYEKQITPVPFHRDLKKEQAVLEEKIIYDINLVSLEILLTILLEKQYDFATFEPSENHVKINFRKDKIVKETRYIKYPTYTNILFKAKSITNLTIEETKEQQDGTGEIVLNTNTYKLITKVVPSDFGSKLFIKIKEADKKVTKKAKQKMSMGQIFTYLGVIAFIALIIGGAFISFVVMNAKTVEDVKFFYSLGINLNDINNFILRAVTVIFSVLIFIETLFLIIYLFK